MSVSPSRAIMVRHSAAMKIIHKVDPAERVKLLAYVIVGSEGIDDAVEAAEAARVERSEAREMAHA